MLASVPWDTHVTNKNSNAIRKSLIVNKHTVLVQLIIQTGKNLLVANAKCRLHLKDVFT